jgi:serine protease Do
LLAAFYVYHRLLTLGEKGFTEFSHGGWAPIYPPLPPSNAAVPVDLASLRVDAEVLNTRHGPFLTKWYFARTDQKLLGFELRLNDNEDPCEVYLSDYREVDGRLLPHRFQVQYGDGHYGTFQFTTFSLNK